MKRQNFNHLYQDEFTTPLSSFGFEDLGRKSLRYTDEVRDLRIVNLAGKFAKPGTLRTIICFRHKFLHPLQKGTVQGEVFNIREFCRKLTFYSFSGTFLPPKYSSQDFYQWGYDSLDFDAEDERGIAERLKTMRTTIVDRVLPWAKTLTPESEVAQMKKYGLDTWYEQRWLKDYEGFIAAQSRAVNGN